jgi:hydroxymethylbilane synthase
VTPVDIDNLHVDIATRHHVLCIPQQQARNRKKGRVVEKKLRLQVDATLLAYAGLRRLDLTEHVTCVLTEDEMLPAIAQGAIGIACRSEDQESLAVRCSLPLALSCSTCCLPALSGLG